LIGRSTKSWLLLQPHGAFTLWDLSRFDDLTNYPLLAEAFAPEEPSVVWKI